MEEVVTARPDYICVSLSGASPETYSATHRGGDIFVVKSNMYMLRHLMDRLKIDIPVQVGYHPYRHNCGRDFEEMKRLCEEVSFFFLPTLAILMPLEKALAAAEGQIDEADKALVDLLLLKPDEWKPLLESQRANNSDCIHRRARTTINYDGSVPLCCVSYTDDNVIAGSFLETSRQELQKRKYSA